MTTHSANRLALWAVAATLVMLTGMLLTLAWWLIEDTAVTPGPAYAITAAGQSVRPGGVTVIGLGEPLRVRHAYCVHASLPGTLNQTLEDGVMVVMPPQAWVRRTGCGEHTFVINLPPVLERGHVYLYRASITTRINPARPAETVWFPPVPFVVEG